MARLFITPREQQLISDWTKEFVKDVVGQFIHYYPISVLKSDTHPVYDEAIVKIFDNPIKIDALVEQPNNEQSVGSFSIENTSRLETYIQSRDLLDKGFSPTPGDFFVYGADVFEILTAIEIGDVFGQAEYNVYWKLTSKLARSGRFDLPQFKKMLEDKIDFEDSHVQKTFEQQRGLKENDIDGATGDRRQVRERLADDMAPIALDEGPRKVDSEDEADTSDTDGKKGTSSFYNE